MGLAPVRSCYRVRVDIAHLQAWIGGEEVRTDIVTAAPMAALAATLDIDAPYPEPGEPLPPLWHWLYFLPIHRQSELAADGHAERGGFLPPVDLPRRMWAGGRLRFHGPVQVGERITRTSRIADVRFKEGRTGPLVFVLVRHEIAGAAGVAITEEHDIVYRDHGGAAPAVRVAPTLAPADTAWERVVHPDDVLLFRYSALTFNGHRIHYDRRYAVEVEGYPGLVVHGPLMATMLADLVRRNMPAARAKTFEFRAVSPVFDTGDFGVCGRLEADGAVARLWIRDTAGGLAMEASLTV